MKFNWRVKNPCLGKPFLPEQGVGITNKAEWHDWHEFFWEEAMVQRTLPDKPRPLTGPNVIFPELSFEIMSVVYEVHNQLGPGYPEEIYQRAAAMEFNLRNVSIEEQKVIPVCYKGKQMGTFRLDMVVDGKIILEFKAVSELNDLFKQQT